MRSAISRAVTRPSVPPPPRVFHPDDEMRAQKRATKRASRAVFCPLRRSPCVVIPAAESWDWLNRAFAQVNYPFHLARACVYPTLGLFLPVERGEKKRRGTPTGPDYPHPPAIFLLSETRTRHFSMNRAGRKLDHLCVSAG